MKILVTGATGYLGRAIADHLGEQSSVIRWGHAQAGDEAMRVDLRDDAALRMALHAAAPDVVVHCAAYRDPDFCEEHPEETRRVNVRPVQTMAETLPAQTRFIFISSDYVFDGENPPYREEDERCPVNVYGRSKQEAEDALAGRDHTIILRIPLLVGAGPSFAASGLIAKIARAIMENQRMELDAVSLRFPTSIRDVARAVDHLWKLHAEGVFHYSSEEGRSQYDWALLVAQCMGADPRMLTPVDAPPARKAVRPRNSQLNIERIKRSGFHENTPFTAVVKEVLAIP
jgi:S-adenosylmethionine synthetase